MINLLAKFEIYIFSRSSDITGGGVPKIWKVGHVTTATPPFGQFFIFRLVSLTINQHTKFEVCIFSRSRDIRGSHNLKSRSRDLGHAPFGPFFICYFCIPYGQCACKIWGLYL